MVVVVGGLGLGLGSRLSVMAWLVLVLGFVLLQEEDDDEDVVEERCMSGRLTTAREPRDKGCSGSEMGAMRSIFVAMKEMLMLVFFWFCLFGG